MTIWFHTQKIHGSHVILCTEGQRAGRGEHPAGGAAGGLKFDTNGNAVKNYAVIKTIKNGEIVYFSTYNG